MSNNEMRLRSGEEARCEDVRLAMGEVLDGVADLTVKTAVETHVRTCPPCAQELSEMKTVVEGVKALADVRPKDGAWKRVEAESGGAKPTVGEADRGLLAWLKSLFGG